ncbi:cyclic nucleotide-binding domain-containing protein [Vagococcus carniphilus]|uniref:cyclic nucleotide-binding domain-containing protein n=1 Tax=Vagococcus carniphilus TaxID=218144 RepID=UPI003B594C4C
MLDEQKLLDQYHLDIDQLTHYKYVHFNPRETIILEGMENFNLLIVSSGKAKVCSTAKNGKNLILSYYLSSGIIGDIEFLTDEPKATTTIIALSPFSCLLVPLKENAAYLKENTPFIKALGKGLTEKLQRSAENFLSTSLYTGEERLCSYLLNCSYKNYFQDNLKEVADTLGLSYRHLLRLLKQLVEDGLIEKTEDGYFIKEEQALKKRSIDSF